MKINVHIVRIILLLLSVNLFVSCNVPEAMPTATITPDWTETPIPPSSTPTQVPTPTKTPIPAYLDVDPASLKETKLNLRCSLDGKVRETLNDLVNQYNDENRDGIIVQFLPAYSSDELSAALSGYASDKADILIADSAWLRNQNSTGLLMDLSGFMNDPALSLEAQNAEPIMPVMLETENQEGRFFALPLWAEPAFLFYNKTWAIELGFPDTPGDLAAFAEQACAAGKANYSKKDESKHGTGGWIISANANGVMSWLLTFSRNLQTPGQILRNDTGEVFGDAAAWLRNLYDNGCAWNSRVKEPYDYFANRYALFYSGTYSDAERQFNAFERSKEYGFDNWDLIVYPGRAAGKETDPRIFADTVSAAVLRGEPVKMNAGWRFILWLYQDQHAAKLALSARGWPVQDNESVTKLYRGSGEDKLYQTLSYRQYLVNSDADENWLTDQRILSDGFAYIFNLSASAEDIPGIWDQIGNSIAEISSAASLSETMVPENINNTGGNYETQP